MRHNCFRLSIMICLLLFVGATASADSFEKLLMPGKVVNGHAKYEDNCNKCHDVTDKSRQRSLCLDCHEKIKADIDKVTGYHGKHEAASRQNCKLCHIDHEGRDADIIKLDKRVFEHEYTDFKLQGAHVRVECTQCHVENKKYREAPLQCYQCHDKNPHHKEIGKKCNSCHSQDSWKVFKFDHDKTKFALKGRHKKINCNSCHMNDRYKNTPRQCYSCHSVDDVHTGKNGKECAKCHGVDDWKKTSFDHDKKTKFSLKGRHKTVSCASCHVKNPYKVKIKKDCYSCHRSDDSHHGYYGKKCNDCHGVSRWGKIHFDHDRDTKYRLSGKHKQAQCVSCHKGYVYKEKLPTKCVDCHAIDNVHKSGKTADCSECHNTRSWVEKISFDHDMSRFPLIGLHAITACDDCHLSKQYKNISMKCNDCHKPDDVHKSRLGIKCESCHNPNGWKYWRFDHAKDTRFKLTGVHDKIDCYDCHNQAVKEISIDKSCGSCHQGDDPHNMQFGRQCEQCHDTESFLHIKMFRR
ncbi:MAG: cytochrome C [Gammaproteobacteria bacterium]|nr:cytochrome C [Gammaproteobacteria bacterium]